jgi:hypothetical protein
LSPPGNTALVTPSLSVREARPDDAAFVAATFSEQLSRGRHFEVNAIVDRVLDSKRVRILVAVGERDRLLGWLVYVPMPSVRALVFAYVRSKQRLDGIAHALAEHAWPGSVGRWVHPGLRGSSTSGLLKRFVATEVPLEEML